MNMREPGIFQARSLTGRACLRSIFLALQRVEHQVGGHQLGQRGGLHRAVDVLGRQDLVGRDVQQQVGARGDFRRLRRLGGSGECGQTQGTATRRRRALRIFFMG
jgi:hypothetical protein